MGARACVCVRERELELEGDWKKMIENDMKTFSQMVVSNAHHNTQENAISHLSVFSFFLFSLFLILSQPFCASIFILYFRYTWYLFQAIFFSSLARHIFLHWNALRFQTEKPIYWRSNQWMLLYTTSKPVINLGIFNKYLHRFSKQGKGKFVRNPFPHCFVQPKVWAQIGNYFKPQTNNQTIECVY